MPWGIGRRVTHAGARAVRWMPISGWGSQTLPTDPGKFSDQGQTVWGNTKDSVAPYLGRDWTVRCPKL